MVAPLIAAAAISSVAGLASGVLASRESRKLSNKARRALESVYSPTVEELSYDLEELRQQGVITPEESRIILQEATQLENVMTDPQLRQYQVEALADFADLAREGGLDPQAQAQLYEVEQDLGRAARGRREAIQTNLRARGLGGAGAELASLLAGEQQAANAGALAGTQIAAGARERELQALDALLSGSSAVRQQEYVEDARRAEQQDAINRFNAMVEQQQIERDIGRRERAQYANLGERQRIADANVALQNEEERSRATAVQQRFSNELGKAGGQAQILQQQIQQPGGYGMAATTLGNVGSALAQRQQSQEMLDIYRQILGGGASAGPSSTAPKVSEGPGYTGRPYYGGYI